MKNSFKLFWKDLWELQKGSNAFLKKHWKGYAVFCLGTFAVCWGIPIGILKIKEKMEERQTEEDE